MRALRAAGRGVLHSRRKVGQAVAAFARRGRKVRTPTGRVMANGHPWQHAEQGNRKQTADGLGVSPGSGKGETVR